MFMSHKQQWFISTVGKNCHMVQGPSGTVSLNRSLIPICGEMPRGWIPTWLRKSEFSLL